MGYVVLNGLGFIMDYIRLFSEILSTWKAFGCHNLLIFRERKSLSQYKLLNKFVTLNNRIAMLKSTNSLIKEA